MIEIRNLQVTPFINGFTSDPIRLRVTWEISDTDIPLSDVEFTVFRSNSPEESFRAVSPPLIDVFDYTDDDVNLFSKNRKYHYKVRAKVISTDVESEIGPARLEHIPDKIGLEIIRRNNLLHRRFVGLPCHVLIRRTFGQRCTCFDHTKRRVKNSRCSDCFRTGFVGGFFQPTAAFVNFDPPPETVTLVTFGETQEQTTAAWMSNFPIISPGDLVIDEINNRWRVARTATTRKQGHIIHQTMALTKIEVGDIEYEFEVDDPRDLIGDLDLKFRREHTVVGRTFDPEMFQSRSVPVDS